MSFPSAMFIHDLTDDTITMETTEQLQLQPKDRLIMALDYSSEKDAIKAVKQLRNHVGLFKVGMTLFMNSGHDVVKKVIKEIGQGSQVFYDVKTHDIPRTMQESIAAIVSSHGIKFVTTHTLEGIRHVAAVVESVKKGGKGTKVLGVTVLTSQSNEDVQSLWPGATVSERVKLLAQIALDGGASGVVCSGHEARAVKQKIKRDFLVVTPGIRPEWEQVAQDDQRRIMTPEEAIKAGADYIVVGRPIYQSKNPVDAAKRIVDEIAQAMKA